jgi:peptidoglycan hydrolase-like protein with peptidoglycan-binding domain
MKIGGCFMKKEIVFTVFMAFLIVSSLSCNIVPKTVQYQKEEESLIGSTDIINPVVEEIQVLLGEMGYEISAADGKMGQKTREAIKEFQESIGIKSTGYINKSTLIQIDEMRRFAEEREMDRTYNIKVRSAYSRKEGSSGFRSTVATKDIQAALKNAGFDPGAIDGKFGPRTSQAIKEFQRAKGLKIDGKVGPQTWGELSKYLEKR